MPNVNPDRTYKIKPIIWFVRDESSVKFHVQNDDYFGTIATILSLIKQRLAQAKPASPKTKVMTETLANLEKDLMFLQKNYEIQEKPRKKIRSAKLKLG